MLYGSGDDPSIAIATTTAARGQSLRLFGQPLNGTMCRKLQLVALIWNLSHSAISDSE